MSNNILRQYTPSLKSRFSEAETELPWNIVSMIPALLERKIKTLSDDYSIQNNIAIHRSAIIEDHVVLKGPIIVGPNCFIGAHAYLRGGVFLDKGVKIGPGCEIKTSIILSDSALAHFNFVGDSIIGSAINMEAGSVIANHYNERQDKSISVLFEGNVYPTGTTKFGAVVGDYSRIGANAVLSPGTLLASKSIVKRLELIEQV